MKFSQRIGITPPEKVIQIGSIDVDLRNSLWTALTVFYWDKFNKDKYSSSSMGYGTSRTDYIAKSNLAHLFRTLWINHFKKPIDEVPELYYDKGLRNLRLWYFAAQWYEVYEFVEFVADNGLKESYEPFIKCCNDFLEKENSGYRFVDGKIIEISSADEIAEIENAIENSTPYSGVKQHLRSAISLLSSKEKPDYRNSIKESISAVESLCKTISKDEKATLGAALKFLEKNGILHPALKAAFSSLYGYTNDADGIRHALMEEEYLSSADARFMLISCSAFINYVIATSIAKA